MKITFTNSHVKKNAQLYFLGLGQRAKSKAPNLQFIIALKYLQKCLIQIRLRKIYNYEILPK